LPPGGCGTRRRGRQAPVTVSTRWRRERPRRSSFQTTKVSPAQLVQELGEGGAVGAGAAGGLGEHPVAARRSEGVDLELWLLVGGGDACVAEEMTHTGTVSQPSDTGGGCAT
jgi:hypothetical protein